MNDLFVSRAAKLMLISDSVAPFDDPGYLFEPKLDGMRCLLYLDPKQKTVWMVNRRDRENLFQFPELSELYVQVSQRCILDGEVITGSGRTTDFEAIKRRWLTTSPKGIGELSVLAPATFVAFDILYLGKEQLTERPLLERKALLAKTLTESDRLSLTRWVEERGIAFSKAAKEQALEGAVAKRIDSPYLMGKRTDLWAKIKSWLEDDFVIGGYLAKKGGYISVLLGQWDGRGELWYKGRVSLSASRPDYARITKQPRAKKPPFERPVPEIDQTVVWLKPYLVCTVGFLSRSEGGTLRQPSFKGLRTDKAAGEVIG